ncbi:MAG TPA: lipase family protein [Baekduia sp.]
MVRTLTAVALAVVAALVLAAAAGAADPQDPFYRTPTPPKRLPGKVHGDVIRQKTLTGAAVVPGAATTRLVIYRSQDVHGYAVPVSGVVSIPKGREPKGGWPVITYAHGTTGIADQCAPSHDTTTSPVHPYNAYIYPLLTRWLKAGYAVVRTDYQGLGTLYDHQYLVGVTEGRSVLDMVRAARQALPGRLSRRIAIAGHSQGGHAALFAAALAPKYTPELSLQGTVAFAPASHLEDQLPLAANLTQPNPGLTALIATIAEGLAAAYGDAGMDPKAFELVDALSVPNGILLGTESMSMCLPELGAEATKLGLTPATTLKPPADLAKLRRLLGANDPSHLKITTPLLIEQGLADQTVVPLFTTQLATELRTNGATRLTYNQVAGVDHAGITAGAGATAATKFIEKTLKRR